MLLLLPLRLLILRLLEIRNKIRARRSRSLAHRSLVLFCRAYLSPGAFKSQRWLKKPDLPLVIRSLDTAKSHWFSECGILPPSSVREEKEDLLAVTRLFSSNNGCGIAINRSMIFYDATDQTKKRRNRRGIEKRGRWWGNTLIECAIFRRATSILIRLSAKSSDLY